MIERSVAAVFRTHPVALPGPVPPGWKSAVALPPRLAGGPPSPTSPLASPCPETPASLRPLSTDGAPAPQGSVLSPRCSHAGRAALRAGVQGRPGCEVTQDLGASCLCSGSSEGLFPREPLLWFSEVLCLALLCLPPLSPPDADPSPRGTSPLDRGCGGARGDASWPGGEAGKASPEATSTCSNLAAGSGGHWARSLQARSCLCDGHTGQLSLKASLFG